MFRRKILKEKRIKKVLIYILIGKDTITRMMEERIKFSNRTIFSCSTMTMTKREETRDNFWTLALTIVTGCWILRQLTRHCNCRWIGIIAAA